MIVQHLTASTRLEVRMLARGYGFSNWKAADDPVLRTARRAAELGNTAEALERAEAAFALHHPTRTAEFRCVTESRTVTLLNAEATAEQLATPPRGRDAENVGEAGDIVGLWGTDRKWVCPDCKGTTESAYGPCDDCLQLARK